MEKLAEKTVKIKIGERGVGVKELEIETGTSLRKALEAAGIKIKEIEGGVERALLTVAKEEANLDTEIKEDCVIAVTPNVKGGM